MATAASSDPLYHDVRPEYERYTRIFFIFASLACLIAMICAVVEAQGEKKFYTIILSEIGAFIFTLCIYLFFKRRILLAEKLWFVNLTILLFFTQAIIYLIFVFVKPYPSPTTTTTFRSTTPFPTTPFNTTNTTNMTNITTTVTSTTVTKKYSWQRQAILTRLYELAEET